MKCINETNNNVFSKNNLIKASVKELKDYCRDLDVSGFSKMNKPELIEIILELKSKSDENNDDSADDNNDESGDENNNDESGEENNNDESEDENNNDESEDENNNDESGEENNNDESGEENNNDESGDENNDGENLENLNLNELKKFVKKKFKRL